MDTLVASTRVTCYANRGGAGNDLIYGFAHGHGCRLLYAEDYEIGDEPGIPLVWGVLRGSDFIVDDAINNGRNFLYCDHAYFDRGHLKNYRILLNRHGLGNLRNCDFDRQRLLNVRLSPWRKTGSHILVCPPTEYFMNAHHCPMWLENTLSTLQAHTDRPIIVRGKPSADAPQAPLSDQLLDCHALVTHSSNIAVEAIIAGVPAVVHSDCAAISVSESRLDRIEKPKMPDRELWLANLAYTQFTFHEILNGTVIDLINTYHAFPELE